MSIRESYDPLTGHSRASTQRSTQARRPVIPSMVGRDGAGAGLSRVNALPPMSWYFEFVQQAVATNRDAAFHWAEWMSRITVVAQEHSSSLGQSVAREAGDFARLTTDYAGPTDCAPRERPESAPRVDSAIIDDVIWRLVDADIRNG